MTLAVGGLIDALDKIAEDLMRWAMYLGVRSQGYSRC